MSRFRDGKERIAEVLQSSARHRSFEELMNGGVPLKSLLNPLLAALARPEARLAAAGCLGLLVPRIAEESLEDARVILRRLMWSMNEESGNVGWGVPEAMGCILARSRRLAEEFGRILVSYGRNTGREDNFVEHAPLRQGVFIGIGVFARSFPDIVFPAAEDIVSALEDEDPGVRIGAAFALRNLLDGAAGGFAALSEAVAERAKGALRGMAEGKTVEGSTLFHLEVPEGEENRLLTEAEAASACLKLSGGPSAALKS